MNRRRSIKLRVPRAVLITRLETAKEKAKQDYEAATVKYDEAVAAYAAKIRVALVDAQALSDDAILARCQRTYGRKQTFELALKAEPPTKPRLELRQIEQQLRVLRAADDEFVSVSADDDFAEHL